MGPEEQLGKKLSAGGYTLATAESCTGGLIAHRVTNVAGSSGYFLGGIVSYGNDAKMNLLGVNETTLVNQGAVSEAVAREMAEGVQGRFESDYAIAVTGIAGPGGGTAEKPVGLVFMAVAEPRGVHVARHVFNGDRATIKEQTAGKALEMLLEYIS